MKYPKGFDPETVKMVFDKSGGKCWYCGKELTIESRYLKVDPDMFVIDHVLPRILGGTDAITNLVPACFSCNSSKGTKSIEEFRGLRSRQLAGMPKFSEEQLEYLLMHNIYLPPIPCFVFYFEIEEL